MSLVTNNYLCMVCSAIGGLYDDLDTALDQFSDVLRGQRGATLPHSLDLSNRVKKKKKSRMGGALIYSKLRLDSAFVIGPKNPSLHSDLS